MGISINTAGWSSSNTIPEDTYEAALEHVEQTTSRSGNPMLVWKFVLVNNDYAGFEVRDYTVLLPTSAWKLDQLLKATGLGEVGGPDPIKLEYDTYVNRMVHLVLVEDTYETNTGEERTRMVIGRAVEHPDGAGVKWGSEIPGDEGGTSIGVPGDKDDSKEDF
jgi:hypothetical protein